uniref:PKS2 n=1 Tax=Agaricomycetes sp. TaxID=1709932 RepID=A0A1L3MZ62_9AGAM|nr:PKS2 [Agaricomycetes sp.]
MLSVFQTHCHNVPLFAGQGSYAMDSQETRSYALEDAIAPAGSILLSACHSVFLADLSSVSSIERASINLHPSDFTTPQSLVSLHSKEHYQANPIVSGMALFLIQTLRYLAHVEASSSSHSSDFISLLQKNQKHSLGVLGFSSGLLPATVVATSSDTLEYINNAVQAFRVAFWIGLRTQLYNQTASDGFFVVHGESPLPWSLVFVGLGKEAANNAISQFSSSQPEGTPQLYVTADLGDSCVTISGRPDVLFTFSTSQNHPGVVHRTLINSLYHSPAHLEGTRDKVLRDLSTHNVAFPSFSDIKTPLRSTFTGDILTQENHGSLLETVVDMILTQPILWTNVVSKLVDASPKAGDIRLLNFGPGTGLTRYIEKSFSPRRIISQDLSIPPPSSSKTAIHAQEPIAIVGMAVDMPGAPNTARLWDILEKGLDTISEIPESRFKVSDYGPSNNNAKRSMKAHTGNFIDGPDAFDNRFFNISPREARSMDPQQRILLHTAYEALEDSGYVPDSSMTNDPSTFGCYIGSATEDYVHNLRNDIDVYYSTGTLRAFLSGRISYALKLSGPSIVTDTACSSSIVAIYQACRSLMNRDCNAALAGGVNVITSPDMFFGLDRAHFLSPTGQCKAFDASADGYSRSEGCGVFVLKRLADALDENDHIYGVIRGIEVNQSGLAHSITHPHAPTQSSLFKQLLARSGVDATRVNVVEAHGTGTQAGDPNELESIRSIFAVNRPDNDPLHITSVKANIGHLEAASGAAALAKLLLMLQYRTIPRQISLRNLNPKIETLASDNVVIDTVATSWDVVDPSLPRVAVINNFGAAGSNSTLMLEEFIPTVNASPPPSEVSFVFGFSAKTPQALDSHRSQYLTWLFGVGSQDLRFADIAYTTTARRQLFSHRLAVSASSREELKEKLAAAPAKVVEGGQGKVAFVFSGQGGQYMGMGSSLYKFCPIFRATIDQCHTYLVGAGFPGILPIITSSAGLSSMEELEMYQAAVFSLEYALSQLWISWGVVPDVLIGHSLGEYTAQVIAGVLSLKGALTIVATRVRLMVQKCALGSTGMLAIHLGSEKVADILSASSKFSSASISCYNSVTDSVVSGPIDQLKALKAQLDAEVKCKSALLTVPFGYHSVAMEPLLATLTQVASGVTIRPPTIPVVSNVLGQVVTPGDDSVFTPEYYARHCAEPVLFDKGISDLLAIPDLQCITAWIEIGPHPTTLPMLKSHPSIEGASLLLASLRKKQDDFVTLSSSLSQLYTSTIPVQWRQVFSHVPVTVVSLPAYPFSKNKFWVQYEEDPSAPVATATISTPSVSLVENFSMLCSWSQFPSVENGRVAIYETPISLLASSILGHTVGDHPLCPASVYHELVLAGAESARTHLQFSFNDRYVALRAVNYEKPLIFREGEERTVKTTVTLEHDGKGIFSVASQVGGGAEAVHCFGKLKFASITETSSKFQRLSPVLSRQIASIASVKDEDAQTITTRTAYEIIFPRVVTYSKEYHTMKALTVSGDGMDGYSLVSLPQDYDRGKFVVHPVFMDTMLHVAGFVANMQGEANDAFICTKADTVNVIPSLIDNDATYGVLISNAWVESEGVMVADATAIEIKGRKRIVAQLKGMHFRKVRLDRLKRGLALAGGLSAPAPAPKRTGFALPSNPAAPSNTLALTSVPPPRTSASHVAHSSDVLKEVTQIINTTCGVSIIDANASLADYGVDSLMSIEIFGKLHDAFPTITLDRTALSHADTVEQIVDIICEGSPVSSIDTPTATSALPTPPIGSSALGTPVSVNILTEVTRIIWETCNLDPSSLNPDVQLDTFGVDSLMSIEIFSKLQTSFLGVPLDATSLAHCNTISEIVHYIEDGRGPIAQPSHSGISEVIPSLSSGETTAVESPNAANAVLLEPGVKAALARVLSMSVDDIGDNQDLPSLGLDSLSAIEVHHDLEKLYSVSLPLDSFFTKRTASAVEALITSLLPKAVTKRIQRIPQENLDAKLQSFVKALSLDTVPVPIQSSSVSDKAPIFLIHDGSGLVHYIRRLSSLDRDVWGVHNPHFMTKHPWVCVEDMAAEYASYATSAASSKPLILGGWSFGGVVAFEAARQLMCSGVSVKGVVLIDSPAPVNHVPLSGKLLDAVTKLEMTGSRHDVARFVKSQFSMNSRMLGQYKPSSTDGPFPRLVLLRCTESFNPPGVDDVPAWLADRGDLEKLVVAWEGLVGAPVKTLDVPGNHFQPFHSENVGVLSKRISEACVYLESL